MNELKFEYYVNKLKIKSFERMAVETDPHSYEWDLIEQALKYLWTRQGVLSKLIVQEKSDTQ